MIVSSHVSPSNLSSIQIAVALIFETHPIMHKAFTRHCLSDAIKNLGVEVKTYARTAQDNAYIVARGFAPRTRVTHTYGLNPVDFSIFHPIKTATQNYLHTNSLKWLDSPCDNLVHPCNTLAYGRTMLRVRLRVSSNHPLRASHDGVSHVRPSTVRSQISRKLTRVSHRDEQTPCPL